jgi:hypothetical protein
MPLSYTRVFSGESSSLPGRLEASYQIPHAHVFLVEAPAHVGGADEVRSSSFIQHVGKGKWPSALVAFEGGASFRVPVFFAAQEEQPLPAPAYKHRTIRAKDTTFGHKIGLHRVPPFALLPRDGSHREVEAIVLLEGKIRMSEECIQGEASST